MLFGWKHFSFFCNKDRDQKAKQTGNCGKQNWNWIIAILYSLTSLTCHFPLNSGSPSKCGTVGNVLLFSLIMLQWLGFYFCYSKAVNERNDCSTHCSSFPWFHQTFPLCRHKEERTWLSNQNESLFYLWWNNSLFSTPLCQVAGSYCK